MPTIINRYELATIAIKAKGYEPNSEEGQILRSVYTEEDLLNELGFFIKFDKGRYTTFSS